MRELKTAGEKFDIVFLDAAKDQYISYYKLALEMLTPSGLHPGGQLVVCAGV